MESNLKPVIISYLKKILIPPVEDKLEVYIINSWLCEYATSLFKRNLNRLITKKLDENQIDWKSFKIRYHYRYNPDSEINYLKWQVFQEEVESLDASENITGSNYFVVLGDKISDSFELTGVDRDLVRLTVLFFHVKPISDLLDKIPDGFGRHFFCLKEGFIRRLATIVGASENQIENALKPNSGLITKGLFCSKEDKFVDPSDVFKKMILSPRSAHRNIKNLVLDKKAVARLTGEDFKHLGEDYGIMSAILSSALSQRAKGVNFLLYGAPGVGKTELAKTLAKELNATLYMVSGKNEVYGKIERITEVNMAQTLVQDERNAILLFDEAEDIFVGETRKVHSKLVLNRILENNLVPVIWVTNHVGDFDKATLRRFSFAYEMTTPPVETMRQIWEKELKRNGISIEKAEIERIVQNYRLPPSYATSAVKATVITEDKGALVRTLDTLEYAITKKCPVPQTNDDKAFNFELLNTDLNLEDLSEMIAGKGILNFSLCLYGPPGTGKSAYVRALAKKLGKKVLQKKTSDLLSKYVGQTEKEIAKSFMEAHRRDEFLVFDEADSFLQDRSQAVWSWEVNHVNEMLAWMETHPLPFACTSNLMDKLDKASLRRFTFKVRFGYLSQEQSRKAYL
ncbi:MAG: ATP-binding protein, partial [Deltaproteobacteria bacterium]|nr:ATP-binding protein [Deltaproteobacteria bacterium]